MFTSNDCPLDPDSVTTNEREQLHTSTTLSLLTQKSLFITLFENRAWNGVLFRKSVSGKTRAMRSARASRLTRPPATGEQDAPR